MAAKGYCIDTDVIALMGWNSSSDMLAQVDLYLEVAETLVDQYCRTRFDQQLALARLYSGTGNEMLVLGYYLKTLTKVEILDESDGSLIEDVTIDCFVQPDEPMCGCYRWIERGHSVLWNHGQQQNITATLRVRREFPSGMRNIRVTGDWGFSPVPPQVRLATAMTVKSLFDLRQINEFVSTDSASGRLVQLKEETDVTKYLPRTARAFLQQFINSRSMV